MTEGDQGPIFWFLTGSQDLYGEETLRQVEEQSRQVVARLDGAGDLPAHVVSTKVAN